MRTRSLVAGELVASRPSRRPAANRGLKRQPVNGWSVDRLRLGIDPRDYLEDVLNRLPSMKAGETASLTPANWLKARQVTTHRAA
jgi:hypothetical protein